MAYVGVLFVASDQFRQFYLMRRRYKTRFNLRYSDETHNKAEARIYYQLAQVLVPVCRGFCCERSTHSFDEQLGDYRFRPYNFYHSNWSNAYSESGFQAHRR